MSSMRFGCIEHLPVHNGEPVFDPATRVLREQLFGARNHEPVCQLTDVSVLKLEVSQLLNVLRELESGEVERLEIRHGLPFKLVTVGKWGAKA
jgi:hypothetical protein